MPFFIIILMRVLFVTSMVFIIGYVFGGFSRRPVLATITKVAVIVSIVMFIATTALSFRFGAWRQQYNGKYECGWHQPDSTTIQKR